MYNNCTMRITLDTILFNLFSMIKSAKHCFCSLQSIVYYDARIAKKGEHWAEIALSEIAVFKPYSKHILHTEDNKIVFIECVLLQARIILKIFDIGKIKCTDSHTYKGQFS